MNGKNAGLRSQATAWQSKQVSGKVGNQREWVELDLNGNLMGRRKLDPLDEFPGVGLTSDHAYVPRQETKVARVFRLNRAMSMWEPVDETGAQLWSR